MNLSESKLEESIEELRMAIKDILSLITDIFGFNSKYYSDSLDRTDKERMNKYYDDVREIGKKVKQIEDKYKL